MYISYLYVQTVTRQCFHFPNIQWGVTAHDKQVHPLFHFLIGNYRQISSSERVKHEMLNF